MSNSILKLKLDDIPISYDPGVDISLMMLSQNESIFDLEVSENFIRTIAYDNDFSGNITFDDFYKPIFQDCIFEYHIPFSIARKTIDDICSFIIALLDEGYYALFLCDTFWIKNYSTYGCKHIEHALLFYGYDKEKEILYGQDYFDFNTKQKQEISFKDVQNSYELGEIVQYTGINAACNHYVLSGLKLNDEYIRPINLEIIKSCLKGFVENKKYAVLDGVYYGIQFFDLIIKRANNDYSMLSIKHLHFIYAHIWFMHFRTCVFQKRGLVKSSEKMEAVIQSLSVLLQQAHMIENKVLKYRISRRNSGFSLIEELTEIKNCYSEIIYDFIAIIEED